MTRENKLKIRLKNGEVAIGIWCVIPSPYVSAIIATSGMDFIIIDLEHSAIGIETADEMVKSAELEDCYSLIRLGQLDEGLILKSLDMGGHGVLVAHMEDRKSVEKLIEYVKYYPTGKRGFSPYTRAGSFGGFDTIKYAVKENERTLTGIILEGVTAVDNIDAILEVPGLDLVYIGAYDLSQDLGFPGQVNHPRVLSYVEGAICKIRKAGVAAGGHVAKDLNDIRRMVDMGMQFITLLPDCALLNRICSEMVEGFREIVKDVSLSE